MAGNNAGAAVGGNGKELVYRECRRNHTPTLGKYITDGCGEFLPGGGENGAKNQLLCAACNCHRNYHGLYTVYTPVAPIQVQPGEPNIDLNQNAGLALALVNGGNNPVPMPEPEPEPAPVPKKRKRTAFTAEQKSRMAGFAEELGWKPKKAHREQIERFCSDMGIPRKTFLVWVSNNRRKAMERDAAAAPAAAAPEN